MVHEDDIFTLVTRLPLFLPMYLMVFSRIGGLMIVAPIYGSQAVPARVRVGLAAVIAMAVFPIVAPSLPTDLSVAVALFGSLGELLIGVAIGLSISLVFSGIQLAGMVIGQQAGLALGEVYNPVLDTDTTLLGQVFFLTALSVFVLAGGHRELMRAMLDTFATIPVMSYRFDTSLVELLTGLLTAVYGIGLRLAAPVLITLLVVTLVLGFLSRTIPQLNILSVGFVVRVVVALLVAGFTLSAGRELMIDSVCSVLEALRQTLGLVA